MAVQSSVACIRYLKGTEVIKFTLFNWSFQISGLTVCFIARMDRNGMETQFSINKKANRLHADVPYLHFTFIVSGAALPVLSTALVFSLFSANNLFLFLRKTSKVNKEIKTYFLPAVLFQISQYSIKERQKLQTTVEEHG